MPNQLSIFEQDWWYDAAMDGQWQQVEYDDGRNLTAKLIFSQYRSRGLTTIGMPTMARVMQPVITFRSNEPKDMLPDQVKALKGLAELLPNCDQFQYTLPPESNLELAYCLAGYSVTPNYTFRSNPGGDHDCWKKMDRKVRYNINTGSKRMGIEFHDDISRYLRSSREFIRNRALKNIIDDDAISRIWDACYLRKQASALSCVDSQGKDLASAIIIWDDRHLYYWVACRNPELNDSSANSVLIWNSMEFARKAGLIFDMDGFASPNAGIFKSGFGLVPYRRFDVAMITSSARLKAAVSAYLVEMAGPRLKARLLAARNAISSQRPSSSGRNTRSKELNPSA